MQIIDKERHSQLEIGCDEMQVYEALNRISKEVDSLTHQKG